MRVIAIDGPAGSGKSTVARAVAQRLGLDYLDTGAMYRAVAFAAIRRNIDPADAEPVSRLARDLAIDVGDTVMVDGVDATIEIRSPEVTRAVSAVAVNPEVRRELVRRQREWAAAHNGGVVEGRDIGTVVFPGAALKIYLTAEDGERASRRSKELLDMRYDQVAADIARRDHVDSTRSTSPLAVADDAVRLDTTGMEVDSVVDAVLALVDQLGPIGPSSTAASGDYQVATRAQERWYAFARALVELVCHALWRVQVTGKEHIPDRGAFVLAPIHRSNIDTPLAGCVTHRRMRFMGKDSMFKYRWSAWLFNSLGSFPVRRGAPDREALRVCEAALEAGEPVVLFPEGARQSGPVVRPLLDGAVFVAARAGVPIIPVGIGGSEWAMPKGKLVRFVKVAVVVGAPIEPPACTEGARVSRRQVAETSIRLHDELQRLFDAAQAQVGRTS